MTLTNIERSSTAWLKLRDEINNRIGLLRVKNDGDLTEVETARLRGRIAALKDLVAWGEPDQPIPVADEL